MVIEPSPSRFSIQLGELGGMVPEWMMHDFVSVSFTRILDGAISGKYGVWDLQALYHNRKNWGAEDNMLRFN